MTDLLYDEVAEQLRDPVRSMLAERSPWTRVLARCEGGEPYDSKLWRTLAVEMGLAGLAVPQRYGGSGAGAREAAVVLEELGRSVAPVPYLGSAVVASAVLCEVAGRDGADQDGADREGAEREGAEREGAEPRRVVDELLTDLASGAAVAALVTPFATAPAAAAAPVSMTVRADGHALTGTVPGVADAAGADTLLVPTAAGLFAVPAAGSGVDRRPVGSLDLTRPLCDVVLDAAPGRLLATGDDAAQAYRAGLTAGAALLASEQLGVAEWCMDSTVDYVRSRVQFGRPVGSFQAVKHRLADLWVEIAQARAVARYAADCLAQRDPDTPVATALAQAYCSGVAVTAAEECIQLHGGVGFSWEHPAHLYLKRAKSAAIGFGTADRHRTALAELVDLPESPTGAQHCG